MDYVDIINTMKHQKSNFKSIGKIIVPLVKKHGYSTTVNFTKFLNIWEAVVGDEISKKAQPIRMKSIKGGKKNILYLSMTGPFMAELSLQTRDIIEKINSYYSEEVIGEIKLQRLNHITNKNVVEIDNFPSLDAPKSERATNLKIESKQLEHALAKMKNNLRHSRKKNEAI